MTLPQHGCRNRKKQISLLVSLKVRESVNISQEGKEELFRGWQACPALLPTLFDFTLNSH